jgi:hypothetical protein
MESADISTQVMENSKLIRRYLIPGSRQFSNYWWGVVIFLAGSGFLTTGLSSYFRTYQMHDTSPSLLSTALPMSVKNIAFFPQGLVMCFYGILGLVFSSYLFFTIFWQVGSGFNEFNKRKGYVRIFRWGFPGNSRRIDFVYTLDTIEGIRVDIKEGITSQRAIYMQVKGKRGVPLTRFGQPLTLEEIEAEATELARFLQIPLRLES